MFETPHDSHCAYRTAIRQGRIRVNGDVVNASDAWAAEPGTVEFVEKCPVTHFIHY